MAPERCTEESRITRNEHDIQTLFQEIGIMKNMRIAQLSTQVLTLIGVIATIAVLIVK